ncbi:TPA: hypothetical protein N0F65_003442 [Lagenidium giganteum]|uniref:EamA domain-containing protein n=1 Tax=Lagenidium giganteum TaxID=4803 RepID=A0AAV2YKR5_9STRA|nr:TPA: hypothetical protein N0F65_003442 [Lagenidium giganteum]
MAAGQRQQIYAFDLQNVSERVHMTRSELVRGLCEFQEHIDNNDDVAIPWARELTPITEEDVQQQVVVMVSSRTIEWQGEEVLSALFPLETEDTVIERILDELVATSIVDTIVLCLPQESEAVLEWIEQICDAIIPSQMLVEYVFLPESWTHDDPRALLHVAMHLDAARSFLLLDADRVFPARTIEIMAQQHFQHKATHFLALVDDSLKADDDSPLPMGIYNCGPTFLTTLKRALYTEQDAPRGQGLAEYLTKSQALERECITASACGPFTWKSLQEDNQEQPRFVDVFVPASARTRGSRRKSSRLEELIPEDSALHAQLDKYAALRVPIRRQSRSSKTPSQATSTTPLVQLPPMDGAESDLEATALSDSDAHDHGGNAMPYGLRPSPALVIEVETHGPKPMAVHVDEVILALPTEGSRGPGFADGAASQSSSPNTRTAPLPLLQRIAHMPSDVQEVKIEAVEAPHTAKRLSLQLVVTKEVPFVGYAVILTALVAVSSQGAALDLLVDVPPLLKLFWRMTGASLAFAPFVWQSVTRRGRAGTPNLPPMTPNMMGLFALCVCSYALYNASFLVALSMTSVGHTYIFSTCHSLLMVFGKLVTRQSVGLIEVVGAIIGFAGGAIVAVDHNDQGTLGAQPATVAGDMVAFAGAFAGMIYLLTAKQLRTHVSIWTFLFSLVAGVATLLLPVLVCFSTELGGIQVWSMDPQRGLFGWVHHLPIEAYVVLIGSFAGTMGFIRSMKYFDPLVVSVTMLMEPVVATIIGIFLGVDALPGLATFVGGAAVLFGCYLVLTAARSSTTKVDISDALRCPPFVTRAREPPQHQLDAGTAANYGSTWDV